MEIDANHGGDGDGAVDNGGEPRNEEGAVLDQGAADSEGGREEDDDRDANCDHSRWATQDVTDMEVDATIAVTPGVVAPGASRTVTGAAHCDMSDTASVPASVSAVATGGSQVKGAPAER